MPAFLPHISFRTLRQYDIRPIDFATGKRVAIAAEDMKVCECCGRKIVRCFDIAPNFASTTSALTVGSECEGFLCCPAYRSGRKNRKAEALLAEGVTA